MKDLWLLIPVKPFRESKSRLAPVMDVGERAALSRQLLEDTLALAQQSGLFAAILVVSRDQTALAIARRAGVGSLDETGLRVAGGVSAKGVSAAAQSQFPPAVHAGSGLPARAAEIENRDAASSSFSAHDLHPEARLNRALTAGQAHAKSLGAAAILVLPADLPLLTLDDLRALVTPLQEPDPTRPALVLAPSHDRGTNALLLRPPGVVPFAFGPRSFDRHRALAQAAGCAVSIVHTPSLTYDIDFPEDLWGEDLGI
jgi:2-phospho-L-lactate/phosphoenolpyruvate guanylyltransferase